MAGHAQLIFVMTECSKTQIRLTGLSYNRVEKPKKIQSTVDEYRNSVNQKTACQKEVTWWIFFARVFQC